MSQTATVIISAITAFIIGAGGALVVAFVGGKPSVWQVATSLAVGALTAAKDTRSLLKLPPVNQEPNDPKLP